jgi:predicted component of type VI protein secretion system
VVELVVTHLSGSRRNAVETFGSLPLKLGRADDNDVRFDPDQDIKVSAHHAEVRSDGEGGLQVVDLSKNGVLVNGSKIEGAAALPNHAVIELGADGPRVQVKYEMGSGGISFSKLKRAAAAEGAQPPMSKHLRTTAEAEAYSESELEPPTPEPQKRGLLIAAVAVVLVGLALLAVLLMS